MMNTLSWLKAPTPPDEAKRLEELRRYKILDTLPEIAFDRLTHMAARHFKMPVSLVSLVDRDRQWFKSHYGVEITEAPRDTSFCAHAILEDTPLIVKDAQKDIRFASNPFVTGAMGVRFYAGAPLKTANGYRLGTLCLIDHIAHEEFGDEQREELSELASIVIDELELRFSMQRVKEDLLTIKQGQQALQEERLKAEFATQEKSRFITTMTHELRTPMNGILGMAYLLGETPLNKTQREYIETINHSSHNLLLLINDVLDISKIESGELILDASPFDIKNSFAQSIKLLKPLANKRGNILLHYVDAAIPSLVIGDQGRFCQIITNLVGNAIKFTEAGTVEVRLNYEPEIHSVYCQVKDTGVGIPLSQHELIFERFTQGDPSITQKYGGTGLGLSITKHLVIKLGGEIGFQSEENTGSSFWFRIPIAQADQAVIQYLHRKNEDKAQGLIDVKNARVLIAEDHPVNQLFLIALLEKFGFTAVDVVENGSEVIEKMYASDAEIAYDVIFMDCRMPVQDGYETTRIIRAREKKLEKAHRTTIIAMTANALSGDRELCLDVGMDEYVTKPVQPDKLKEALRKWFIFSSDNSAIFGHTLSKESYSNPPMDMARLNMVIDTDEEKIALLTLFFRASKDYLTSMTNSRRSDEAQIWKSAAHSLKGSAGNLGMSTLAKICQQAEDDATKMNYAQRNILLEQLGSEIERIKNYVYDKYPSFTQTADGHHEATS